jgi:Arc/MetJ family transcription regulator
MGLCVYITSIIHTQWPMRTNIEIDDKLLQDALRVTGLKTKRAVVEAGLRMLLRLKRQESILSLAGKVHWEGNLDESRQGRDFNDPR